MPLLQPMVDLVLGLALRFIVWAVVAGAKLAARLLWSAVSEYPGFTFIGLLTARDAGWISSPWLPFVLAALGVLAIVRFLTAHPPAEIAQQVRREARKAVATGAAITESGRKARGWVHRRRRTDQLDEMPLPPRPVATDTAGDRIVADVDTRPDPPVIPLGPVLEVDT